MSTAFIEKEYLWLKCINNTDETSNTDFEI